MDLAKLFEMQKKLDEHIEREHPRQKGEERINKKFLALKVELGEMANELPEVFKFWSNKTNNYDKALKEYVDAIHFILSIGLEIDTKTEIFAEPIYFEDATIQFNELFGQITYLASVLNRENEQDEIEDEYERVWSLVFGLAGILGFTWEQIEHAYIEKNEINHERQVNGY